MQYPGLDRQTGRQAGTRLQISAHVTGASASGGALCHAFQSPEVTPGSASCIFALHTCEVDVGQHTFLLFFLVSWLLFGSIMVAECVIFSLSPESKQARLYRVLTSIGTQEMEEVTS